MNRLVHGQVGLSPVLRHIVFHQPDINPSTAIAKFLLCPTHCPDFPVDWLHSFSVARSIVEATETSDATDWCEASKRIRAHQSTNLLGFVCLMTHQITKHNTDIFQSRSASCSPNMHGRQWIDVNTTSTVLKSHQAGKVTSSPWHGGDTEKSHQVVESHIREEESPWHSLFHL